LGFHRGNVARVGEVATSMNANWKSQQIGYDDVPLAIREIVRCEQEFRFAGWVVAAGLILANLIGLSVMVVVAQWLMPSVNPVITVIVTAAAYVVGVIAMGIEKLSRRLSRMEIHALTLHDEILCSQNKLSEIESGLDGRKI